MTEAIDEVVERKDVVIAVGEEPQVITTTDENPEDAYEPVPDHSHGDGHDHDHPHDHTHDEPHEHSGNIAYTPQPVPMSVNIDTVSLMDGGDRIRVEYASVNGTWVVFYEREFAIKHANTLLAAAYSPPVSTDPGPISTAV